MRLQLHPCFTTVVSLALFNCPIISSLLYYITFSPYALLRKFCLLTSAGDPPHEHSATDISRTTAASVAPFSSSNSGIVLVLQRQHFQLQHHPNQCPGGQKNATMPFPNTSVCISRLFIVSFVDSRITAGE